jgi:hypothetical protein
MKVELKKLTLYPRMSQETTCFAADVWVDGKKVGHAKNDGCGGATLVFFADPRQGAVLEEALKKQVPAKYAQFGSGAEWAVDQIVDAERIKKDTAKNDATFKRTCTKRGTAAARFDIIGAFGKETLWVEYGKGNEAAAKAKMQTEHATLENWVVVA